MAGRRRGRRLPLLLRARGSSWRSASYLLVVCHREKAGKPRGRLPVLLRHARRHAGGALRRGAARGAGGGARSASPDLAALDARAARRRGRSLAHGGLLLILLGFLVKAGCFPFGMWWLPAAHPAAPSPASALLSGAMIKLGLYGILRVFFEILPVGPLVARLGADRSPRSARCRCSFGTVTALFQSDSKRLLAYSSIGQVGYMLLGFGLALGLAASHPALAAVALVGGLFHLLNHACFKGLLFLNAGYVRAGDRRAGPQSARRPGPRRAADRGLSRSSRRRRSRACPRSTASRASGCSTTPRSGAARGRASPSSSSASSALFISAVTLALFVKFLGRDHLGRRRRRRCSGRCRSREMPWLGPSQLALGAACVALGLFPVAGAWLCVPGRAAAIGRPGRRRRSRRCSVPGGWSMEVRDAGCAVGAWSPLVVGGDPRGGLRRGDRHPAVGGRGAARRGDVGVRIGGRGRGAAVQGRALLHAVQGARCGRCSPRRSRSAWRAEVRRLRPSSRAVTATLNPDGWALQRRWSRDCCRRSAGCRRARWGCRRSTPRGT